MCGIVGFMTKETKKLEIDRAKFLKQALIIDTLRGDDSTGAFAIGHKPLYDDGSAYWLKQVCDGYDFVHSKAYWESFYDTTDYRAVVGHNRAATVGAVDTDGAHPFQVGPITLVHNGTLTVTHTLPSPMHSILLPNDKGELTNKVSVDSHAIAYNLAHHDVEEVIEKLDGAFALVWHDSRDDSINIIRNDQRPLHMAMSNQQDTMYFMSEAEMLHLLDRRLKLGLREIFYPKAGQWLKWLPDTDLTSPIVKNCELYARPNYGNYNRYGGGFNNGVWGWGDADDDGDDDPFGTGDYSSAMGGNNSGKAFTPTADNRVWVGGRQIEIPDPMQEALLEYDLMVEDRLPFKPKLKDDSGVRSSIIGELDGQLKAILYSQTPASGSQMDRTWTVRPIGVLQLPSEEPLIVTRLVSTLWQPSKRVSGKEMSNSWPQNPNNGYPSAAEWTEGDTLLAVMHDDSVWKKEKGSEVWVEYGTGNCPRDSAGRSVLGYDDTYQERLDRLRQDHYTIRGPNDTRISAEEYIRLTLDGCCVCHRDVGLSDADDIMWSVDGQDFVCWDCDAKGEHIFYGDGMIH